MKWRFAVVFACCATGIAAEVSGVDVSKWQGGDIDYAAMQADGTAYVFVKATEGDTEVDPDYARNYEKARGAGLIVGAYHFYITGDTPQGQFANFARVVALAKGDLPPVVDIEDLSGGTAAGLHDNLMTFLKLVEDHYGARPIIYSGESFANADLDGFGAYPLWVAEYTTAPAPRLPVGWQTWTFWQYTQAGRVKGIDGAVDQDRFNGDMAALEALRLD